MAVPQRGRSPAETQGFEPWVQQEAVIFAASGSAALLADLIHNFGDALTAAPLGIVFAVVAIGLPKPIR